MIHKSFSYPKIKYFYLQKNNYLHCMDSPIVNCFSIEIPGVHVRHSFLDTFGNRDYIRSRLPVVVLDNLILPSTSAKQIENIGILGICLVYSLDSGESIRFWRIV